MKTRVRDLPAGFSFEYGEGKRPSTWHSVGGKVNPVTWPTAAKRDRARALFSRRRTVDAAMADLKKARLLTGEPE